MVSAVQLQLSCFAHSLTSILILRLPTCIMLPCVHLLNHCSSSRLYLWRRTPDEDVIYLKVMQESAGHVVSWAQCCAGIAGLERFSKHALLVRGRKVVASCAHHRIWLFLQTPRCDLPEPEKLSCL